MKWYRICQSLLSVVAGIVAILVSLSINLKAKVRRHACLRIISLSVQELPSTKLCFYSISRPLQLYLP